MNQSMHTGICKNMIILYTQPVCKDNTIFINYNNFIEIKRKTEEAN